MAIGYESICWRRCLSVGRQRLVRLGRYLMEVGPFYLAQDRVRLFVRKRLKLAVTERWQAARVWIFLA